VFRTGVQKLSKKNWKPPQNSRCQEGEI